MLPQAGLVRGSMAGVKGCRGLVAPVGAMRAAAASGPGPNAFDHAIAVALQIYMGLRVARLLPEPAAARRLAPAVARAGRPTARAHTNSWRRPLACASSSARAADGGGTAAAVGGGTLPAAAPPATAAVAAQVASSSSADVLSTAALRRFITERGIAAEVVPPLDGAAPPPGCCELKSLVFLAGGQPVVSD